jgi:hypothetical protein
MSKISQREAQRLRRRVQELERAEKDRRSRWATDYPGGVHIDTIKVSDAEWHIVNTARLLGHAAVVVPGDMPQLRVYGLRLPG